MARAPNDPVQEEIGVHAVGTIFSKEFGWAFRQQPVLDWGIDAHVEIAGNKELTGKLFALQIKCGKSFFKTLANGNIAYYGEPRHRRYWSNHSLPVFIVIHNPETNITLWQKFDPALLKDGEGDNWSIEIPPTNVLEPRFRDRFENSIPSGMPAFRRFMMTIDRPSIEVCIEAEKDFALRMEVDEWINKGLNMRDVRIYLGEEPGAEPDMIFHRWMPSRDINRYMAVRFPWLDYQYAEAPEEYSGEILCHVFDVSVNALGKAVVEVERFVDEGAEEQDVQRPSDDADEDYGPPDYYDADDDDQAAHETYQESVAKDVI